MEMSIRAIGNTAGGQMASIQQVDSVSRNIENKIVDKQREMQQLSSKEDVSEQEKIRERQELQQEIAKLNAELRRRETEENRKERQEELAKEVRGDAESRGVEYTPSAESRERKGPSTGEEAMIAGEQSAQQMSGHGRVIAGIEGDIVVLKGEMKLDEIRGGESPEGKKEELARLERRAQKAADFRNTAMDDTRKSVKAAQARADKATETKAARTETETRDKVLLKATNYMKENSQEEQQKFYVSLGNV